MLAGYILLKLTAVVTGSFVCSIVISCPIIVGLTGAPPPEDMQSYLRRVRAGHGDLAIM